MRRRWHGSLSSSSRCPQSLPRYCPNPTVLSRAILLDTIALCCLIMPNRTLIDFAGRTTVSCANPENQENHANPLFEDEQFPSVSWQLGYQRLAIVFGSGSIFPRTRKRRQANTTYSTVISPSASSGCYFRKNRHHRSSSKTSLLPQ